MAWIHMRGGRGKESKPAASLVESYVIVRIWAGRRSQTEKVENMFPLPLGLLFVRNEKYNKRSSFILLVANVDILLLKYFGILLKRTY